MSEHKWILENLASYNAGGLEPDERERLEQHTAECAACAQALEEARSLDQTLEALFMEARPSATLEDRMIQSLRTRPVRNGLFLRIAMSAAAVLLFGVVGAGASYMISQGNLAFPGASPETAVAGVESSARASKWVNAYRAQDGFVAQKGTSSTGSATDGTANTIMIDESKPSQHDHFSVNWRDQTVSLKDATQLADELRSKAELGMPGMGGAVPGMGMGMGGLMGRVDSRMTDGLSETTRAAPARDGEGKGDSSYRRGVIGGGKAAPAQTNNSPVLNYYSLINAAPAGAPHGPVAISADGKTPATTGLGTVQMWEQPTGGGKYKFGLYAGFKPAEAFNAQRKESKSEDSKSADAGKSERVLGNLGGDNKTASAQGKPVSKLAVAETPAAVPRKIVIRTGEIEFEIESFDSAVATVTKLVNVTKGGFVGTVNSERLPNGKVRGSMVVRVPPEDLDSLVLDLRKELGKGGELRSLRIGSQDITKQYTDLESRLKAARAMEERLLRMIKDGKGEIKDLLNAEKELGIWRTKIEEFEGEIRYYANQVALSTLTITLYEKEIRSPYAIIETERVQMGIEVEDVDKAQQQALAAVAQAKGRVTKSELKQQAAGQFNALIHFEIAPDAAGPIRDRLRQLGNVARLEIDRSQQTEGGSGKPEAAKSKRNDTQYVVSLYNVANVAPRETVHINLACVDTEAVYKTILARVEKAAGRVLSSNLTRQKADQTTGTIQFEVKSAEAEAVLLALKEAGEVMRLLITENPDAQNVTRSKRGFNVQLWALSQVEPRETATLHVATRDVPGGYRAIQEAVLKAKGRMLNSQLNEQDKQNVNAQLDFDLRRTEEAAVYDALAKVGDIYSRNSVRAQDNENVLDSKVRVKVSLINAASLSPLDTSVLGIEVRDVEKTMAELTKLAETQGRTVQAHVEHDRTGKVKARLVFDVPFASASSLVESIKLTGTVRVQQSTRNPQVPDTKLAVARVDVTLSNTELIVPSDNGLWPQVRNGLSYSLKAIFLSLTWVIFGVLVLLPWAVVLYAVYRIVLRMMRPKTTSVTPAA